MRHIINTTTLLTFSAVVLVSVCTGCLPPDEHSAPAPLAQSGDELQTMNGLTHAEFGFNAVLANPHAREILTNMALDAASYTMGTSDDELYLREQLRDPYAQEAMRYLVACALPDGVLVDWQTPESMPPVESGIWSGKLGLCPDWEFDAPPQNCHPLVSSCMLALENGLGEEVSVSVRGEWYSAPDEGELAAFAVEEGAFYGNLFGHAGLASNVDIWVEKDNIFYEIESHVDSDVLANRDALHNRYVNTQVPDFHIFPYMYACWAQTWAYGDAYMHKRVCALPDSNHKKCVARPVGPCEDGPLYPNSGVCAYKDEQDDHYEDCKGIDPVPWASFPTTVFLECPCDIVGGCQLAAGVQDPLTCL